MPPESPTPWDSVSGPSGGLREAAGDIGPDGARPDLQPKADSERILREILDLVEENNATLRRQGIVANIRSSLIFILLFVTFTSIYPKLKADVLIPIASIILMMFVFSAAIGRFWLKLEMRRQVAAHGKGIPR